MHNFEMLKLVKRTVTARLWKVKDLSEYLTEGFSKSTSRIPSEK